MTAELVHSNRAGLYLHGHDMFLKRVGGAFNAFIEATERSVRGKCQEDLLCTTRYITWSLHTRNGAALRGMLGDVRSACTPPPLTWHALSCAQHAARRVVCCVLSSPLHAHTSSTS